MRAPWAGYGIRAQRGSRKGQEEILGKRAPHLRCLIYKILCRRWHTLREISAALPEEFADLYEEQIWGQIKKLKHFHGAPVVSERLPGGLIKRYKISRTPTAEKDTGKTRKEAPRNKSNRHVVIPV